MSGWYGLLEIIKESAKIAESERTRPIVDCPECATPLQDGPNGQRYCPFDGWRDRA